MSLPALPAEIHETIIESIAGWMTQGHNDTFSTCAFVCKMWHSFTLHYTFRVIRLVPGQVRQGRLSNSTSLLPLMEKNPAISKCVKGVNVVLYWGGAISAPDEKAFEEVCRLCTNISYLYIVRGYSKLDSRPFARDGILHILKSPTLKHLSFLETFRSSLLEAVSQHLTSLSFYDISDVVLDHRDGSKLSKSPQKIKLERQPATAVATMHRTPALRQIFERTSQVSIGVHPQNLQSAASWDGSLTWANCVRMDLTFTLNFESSQDFLSYCQDFPWSSFSALKTLKFLFYFMEAIPEEGDASVIYPTWVTNPDSPSIFLSGPSRLKTLESLQLDYLFFYPFFKSAAQVDRTLQEFLRDSLDPNFHAVDTFPSLKKLGLFVRMIGTPEVANLGGVAERSSKNMLSKKLLPSIFGPGGRCEADGWAASVDVGVNVDGGQRYWPL